MDLKGTAAGGYSVFQIGTSAKFKIVRVHQWSYEHFVGPIPPGMHACRKCDFPHPGASASGHGQGQRRGCRPERPQRRPEEAHPGVGRRDTAALRRSGVIMKELAVVYGVSKDTIMHAIQEQNYKRFDRAEFTLGAEVHPVRSKQELQDGRGMRSGSHHPAQRFHRSIPGASNQR